MRELFLGMGPIIWITKPSKWNEMELFGSWSKTKLNHETNVNINSAILANRKLKISPYERPYNMTYPEVKALSGVNYAYSFFAFNKNWAEGR
jgi:hypothetical protein